MSDETTPKPEIPEALKKAARKKISDGLCYLLGGNRFYYYIISNIKVQATPEIPTLEVGFSDKKTNKVMVRYNPQFIADFAYEDSKTGQMVKYDFTEQEIADILVHELLHICLKHLFNCEAYQNKDVLNYAQDIVVNDMIFRNRYEYTRGAVNTQNGLHDKPTLMNFLVTKHLFEPTQKLNIEEHTFGDIYSILDKEFQKNPQMKQKLEDMQGKGQLIKDKHTEFKPDEAKPGDETEAKGQGQEGDPGSVSKGEMEAMLKNLLNKAMKENFDRGRLPGELLKELDMLQPKKDYKDTLNHFVKNCKVDTLTSTWKRTSRRFGPIARGTTADFKPNILLGVDSSGSVFCHPQALEKIAEYFSFATQFCDKIRLVYCDTSVRLDKEFRQGDTIPEIKGGGGTVMQPIFDKGLEDQYDAVVLITDGYTDNINTYDLPHIALIVPGGQTPPGIEECNTVFFDDDE